MSACITRRRYVESAFQIEPLLSAFRNLDGTRSKRRTNDLEQAARTLALQAAYRKAQADIKRDDAPSAGEIRRLGVLDAPLEEKNLKPSKWFPHKEIN